MPADAWAIHARWVGFDADSIHAHRDRVYWPGYSGAERQIRAHYLLAMCLQLSAVSSLVVTTCTTIGTVVDVYFLIQKRTLYDTASVVKSVKRTSR